MLKPKKNIAKKEIQIDPLLVKIDKAQSNIEKNKNLYLKVLLGFFGLLTAMLILFNKNSQNNLEADKALGRALVSLDMSDFTTADFLLENILNDFDGTPSAKKSMYHLGKRKYDSGDFDLAKNHLSEFIKTDSDDLLVIPALLMLIDIFVADNNFEVALKLINKQLKNSLDNYNYRNLKLKKADLLVQLEKYEEAKKIIDVLIKEKTVSSDHKKIAEELMGKMVG